MAQGYGAFNEGYDETQNALAAANQEAQKNAALNSLAQMYGPQAYDPEAALQMQSYGQNQQMNPLLVQQQQMTNTDNQDKINYNESSAYPTMTQENTDKLQTDANAVTTSDMTLKAQQGLQYHSILSGALTNLNSSLQGVTDPGQRAAIFDQEATRLSSISGADPQTVISQLSPYKQAIVSQGTDALPGIQNDLNSGLQSAMTPLDQAKYGLIQSQIAGQNAKTAATTAKTGAAAAGKQGDDPNMTASAYDQIATRVGTVVPTIQSMQALVPQMSTNPVVRKINSALPWTPEYQFEQYAQQLGPNLSLDDARSMKAIGLTGVRYTQNEFTAAKTAMGNLDLTQNPSIISGNLATLAGGYQAMQGDVSKAQAAARAKADAANATNGATTPPTSGAVPLAPAAATGAGPALGPGSTTLPAGVTPAGSIPQAQPGTQPIPLPPGQLGQAIQQVTSDPAEQAYLTNVSGIESDFGRNDADSSTGAKGPFQFVGGTAKAYGLTDPQDPVQAAQATLAYAQDNAKALTAAGVPVTPENLYLAHNLGGGGAVKLLNADPSRLAAGLVGTKAITVNGMPANSTAGEYITHFANLYDKQSSRLGGSAAPSAGGGSILTPAAAAQQKLMSGIFNQANSQPPITNGFARLAAPAAGVPGVTGGATTGAIAQVAQAAATNPLALTQGAAKAPAPPAGPAATVAPTGTVQAPAAGSSGVTGTGADGVDSQSAQPKVKLLPWEQVLAQSTALAKKYGVEIGKRG